MRCPCSSTSRRAACTPTTCRRAPRRAVWRARTPTSRTFPSGRRREGGSVPRSFPAPACASSARTTRRSSSPSSPILSQDPILLDAFPQGKDIHRQTAALIFGVEESQVTPEQRRVGKTINFGVVYGMSSFGLAREPEDPARRGGQVHHDLFPALPGRRSVPEGDHQGRGRDRVRAYAHGTPAADHGDHTARTARKRPAPRGWP